MLSHHNSLYLIQKQSIQAQVASESAHELDEIQRAIAAESQSSRGSASIGNGGASVVGGAPAGVTNHFLAVFAAVESLFCAVVITIIHIKTKAVPSFAIMYLRVRVLTECFVDKYMHISKYYEQLL